MLYSSGTTGRPKGVRHPLSGEPIDAPKALVGLLTMLFGAREDSIYLSPAPLYHAAPLRYCMMMQCLGATIVVMTHFDAEQALADIEKYKATISQWVPTMFVRMLKLPEEVKRRYDLSSLRFVAATGSPCAPAVKRAMIDWWGPVFHECYASSEAGVR